jgi:hypothetical protein
VNSNSSRIGIIILRSDRIDFKPKTITGEKGNNNTMTRRSIHQEEKTILNMYGLNRIEQRTR